MKQADGFILLVVLVFMQILSLLALDGLLQASLLRKSHLHQLQADNLGRIAENVLPFFERQLFENCCVTPLSVTFLASQSVKWWQAHACHKNVGKQTFYYLWEKLGREQCGMFNQKLRVVEFYRLSVFASELNTAILLQSVIAKSTNQQPRCKTKPSIISSGRQLYRFIN